jgi:catechol 2,3-dioxygenase-like lactoylglutathione lyase family enzyme
MPAMVPVGLLRLPQPCQRAGFLWRLRAAEQHDPHTQAGNQNGQQPARRRAKVTDGKRPAEMGEPGQPEAKQISDHGHSTPQIGETTDTSKQSVRREIVAFGGGNGGQCGAGYRRRQETGRSNMPTVTWDHVHLRSPDPEATATWLQDILGGQIIRSPGRIDVKLGGANVFIAPVTAGDGVHSPPVTPYQGLDHFGLTVKDIDDVAADLKRRGVEFTKEPVTIRPGVRICFIRGPQGISVELLERDKKYA